MEPNNDNTTNNANNGNNNNSNSNLSNSNLNNKKINTEEKQKRAMELKDIGNKKYSEKNYNEAVDFYNQAIALLDKAELYGNRAAAFLLMEKYDDALEDCLAAIRLDTNYKKGYVRGMRCYRELGKLDDAKRFTSTAVRLFPNDPEIKEQADKVNICYEKVNRIKQRLSKISKKYYSLYEHIMNINNDNNNNNNNNNDTNKDEDGDQDMKQDKNRINTTFFNIDTTKSYKIETHDANECDNILSSIQTLLDTEMSKALDLKCLIIETNLIKQDFANALTQATNLLRINQNYGPAIKIRAIALFKNGHHDSAIKHIKTVMSQDPDNKEIHQLFRILKNILRLKEVGNDAFKNGNNVEAISKYSECIAHDPTNFIFNSVVYANRAAAWLSKSEYGKACNDCTLCIECDPQYVKAYIRRSKAHAGLEKYEDAVNDAEAAYKLDPGNNELKQLVRDMKMELKKSKRKNYYKILGIDKTSDEQQIKKGFRAQAMKWHPDKFNTAPEDERKRAEEKFKEIGEAYEILKDPQLRERYDAGYDIEDIKNGGMGGFSGANVDISHIFDLLGQMGGGGMGGMGGMGGQSFSFRFG